MLIRFETRGKTISSFELEIESKSYDDIISTGEVHMIEEGITGKITGVFLAKEKFEIHDTVSYKGNVGRIIQHEDLIKGFKDWHRIQFCNGQQLVESEDLTLVEKSDLITLE